MAQPTGSIRLNKQDVEWLKSTSRDSREQVSKDNLSCCRKKLETIGILFPTSRRAVVPPPHAVPMNPAWLTPTVTTLAQLAYKEGHDSGRVDAPHLSILADALEEAGCDNQDALEHLRCPGPHARECLVLDALLPRA